MGIHDSGIRQQNAGEKVSFDDYDDFGTISFAVPCKFDVESFAMDFIDKYNEDDEEKDEDRISS